MACLGKRYDMLYKRYRNYALNDGFTEDDLNSVFIDDLLKEPDLYSLEDMVRLAYSIGTLRGIKICDDSFTASVSVSTPCDEDGC